MFYHPTSSHGSSYLINQQLVVDVLYRYAKSSKTKRDKKISASVQTDSPTT